MRPATATTAPSAPRRRSPTITAPAVRKTLKIARRLTGPAACSGSFMIPEQCPAAERVEERRFGRTEMDPVVRFDLQFLEESLRQILGFAPQPVRSVEFDLVGIFADQLGLSRAVAPDGERRLRRHPAAKIYLAHIDQDFLDRRVDDRKQGLRFRAGLQQSGKDLRNGFETLRYDRVWRVEIA